MPIRPLKSPLPYPMLPVLLFSASSLIHAQEPVVRGARCAENLCLIYLAAQADSDGDGVSDSDEKSAGTDPYDAGSHPSSLEIAKHIGGGRLESFNRGFSEIVILPAEGPDGKELVSSEIRELKPATLEALGISGKTLSRFGISPDGGFSLSSALPTLAGDGKEPSADAPPPRKIGGINIALYSDDENGVNMGPGFCTGCKNPDGQTVKTEGTWWEKVKEFFGGSGSSDGGTKPPDGGKPDGGTMTDPDAVPVVPIGDEEYRRAWFKAKGGSVSFTAGADLPSPSDGEPPVLGRDPNGPIILVNPDESGSTFGARAKLIVVPDPDPMHTPAENTTYGPRVIGGIVPGSAVPKE